MAAPTRAATTARPRIVRTAANGTAGDDVIGGGRRIVRSGPGHRTQVLMSTNDEGRQQPGHGEAETDGGPHEAAPAVDVSKTPPTNRTRVTIGRRSAKRSRVRIRPCSRSSWVDLNSTNCGAPACGPNPSKTVMPLASSCCCTRATTLLRSSSHLTTGGRDRPDGRTGQQGDQLLVGGPIQGRPQRAERLRLHELQGGLLYHRLQSDGDRRGQESCRRWQGVGHLLLEVDARHQSGAHRIGHRRLHGGIGRQGLHGGDVGVGVQGLVADEHHQHRGHGQDACHHQHDPRGDAAGRCRPATFDVWRSASPSGPRCSTPSSGDTGSLYFWAVGHPADPGVDRGWSRAPAPSDR